LLPRNAAWTNTWPRADRGHACVGPQTVQRMLGSSELLIEARSPPGRLTCVELVIETVVTQERSLQGGVARTLAISKRSSASPSLVWWLQASISDGLHSRREHRPGLTPGGSGRSLDFTWRFAIHTWSNLS
jgi:hypothetical protein